MLVTKRNNSLEEFNLDKIHKVLNWATEGIDNVSVSDIEMNAKLSLKDKITTSEIHKILIKSAADLISEEYPFYQYVAARLSNYALRKDVWGSNEPPRLFEHIKKMVNENIYDRAILDKYTEAEIHKIQKFVKHDRDNEFTYAGIQQMMDKYLLKNRKTGQIYETPQFAYILISMTIFADYPAINRMEYVRKCYDYLSQFKISLPTPIMSGVRSTNKQFTSCILATCDDSLDSIFTNATLIGQYVAKKAGIGLEVSNIRAINSPIRGGEVVHTGIIPFLKLFESAIKSCSQGGIRKGSATITVNFFHYEIMDLIVLKNNAGTDDNRVRGLDYAVCFSKLFYDRLINNENITLFSANETPELNEKFGLEGWDELYKKYESDPTIKQKKVVKARELAQLFCKESLEVGRIYYTNIDHANTHSSFIDRVVTGNLCQEVLFPISPLKSLDDEDGSIGTCILSALNMLKVKKEEIKDVMDITVRILDVVIDIQEYPFKQAEKFCKERRAIGIGVTNLAAWLAKQKVFYTDDKALTLIDEYMEQHQYYALLASAKLAQEIGPCSAFDKTKYSLGILPIDTYKKDVDAICNRPLSLDWEYLRNMIKTHGLRHSTLTSIQPTESTSVCHNATNGIEPVRSLISYKKSKSGLIKQVVPNFSKYKDYYTLAFDVPSNMTYTNISAVIQKYVDMGISMNHYYNYKNYEDGNIPISVLIKDMLYAYKMGIKTRYYVNTPDGDTESSCAGGACTI